MPNDEEHVLPGVARWILRKGYGGGFEVGLSIQGASWEWKPLASKRWPSARKESPKALRVLLRAEAEKRWEQSRQLHALGNEIEHAAQKLEKGDG
jgi:hypothetical protein